MSSTSGSGQAASKSSKSRGPYTARGKSCSNCRRRKIKCDGTRPVCSQCLCSSGTSICDYNEANHSELQTLEANIRILQDRVRELENSQEIDDARIRLHQPYMHQGSKSADESVVKAPRNHPDIIHQPPGVEEVLTQPLLDIFLRYAKELGFFLHIPRFRDSALLPTDTPGRPSKGLLSSISLLGFHLSGLNFEGAQHREHAYLARAQNEVPNILSSSHPDRILQAIQAEILLSNYYFRIGRILEGKYHLHAALSITFGSKLHKLHSQSTVDISNIFSIVNLELDAPLDQIAEGERINAFWIVFSLTNCWAVAADSPQNFMLESIGPTVDTPWPLDMTAYEQGALPFSLISGETVTSFLKRDPSSTSGIGYDSPIATFAKCSILLGHAAILAAAQRTEIPPEVADAFAAQFTAVDELLASFDSTLRPLNGLDSSSENFPFIFTAHLMKNVAIITLHSKFRKNSAQSAHKVLSAAESSVVLIEGHSELAVHVNPLLASLWMSVGQVLIEEIGMIRSGHHGGFLPGREQELHAKLHQVFVCMTCAPVPSRVDTYMLSKLQEMYRNA